MRRIEVAEAGPAGRSNQRSRTRKDLLQAAARLMKSGRKPSLDDVAEEAMVSRATAYRYFSRVEDLLVEAALHVAVPEPDELFADAPAKDPVARVQRVDAVIQEMMEANEASLRMMLISSLERGLRGDTGAPARQNRRTPLIEAALEPARSELDSDIYERLVKALALIVGTEAMVVFKDVLQVGDQEAREVKRWAIRALVEAARKPRSSLSG